MLALSEARWSEGTIHQLMSHSRIVELHETSPQWALWAVLHAAKITDALGPVLVCVHHIGSTAITGIKAKPTIDLIPEVRDLEELDAAKEKILLIGFQWWGEYGLPGRRFCPLNDATSGRRIVNAHFYQTGSKEIERHVAFRDFLLQDPELAKQYEAEKLRCQALHPNDTHAYTDAKNDWIKAVEKQALAWSRSRSITPAD